MTHDEARQLLAPLTHECVPQTHDVTASVMRDVRRLAAAPDDRLIWRVAAAMSVLAAAAVVVAAIAIEPADNPLAEFAQQTTQSLEAR